MGYVQVVSKQQLERVSTGGKVEVSLRSAVAEMDVLSVCRHWQA